MATAIPNSNINIPYSAFLDPTTGRPTQAWLLWLMSPNLITANLADALPVTSGGNGLSTIPTNGQLLIGNGSKVRVAYTENVYEPFGGGINLYLNAVQVIELVEYQNKSAQAYGFDVEESVSAFDIAGVEKDEVPF